MRKIILKAQDEEGNPLELVLSLKQGGVKPVIKTAIREEVVVINGKICPNCGKRTWDNRKKIETGMFSAKSPHFSCMDKQGCGWAAWRVKETNTYKESKEAGGKEYRLVEPEEDNDTYETAKEIFDE